MVAIHSEFFRLGWYDNLHNKSYVRIWYAMEQRRVGLLSYDADVVDVVAVSLGVVFSKVSYRGYLPAADLWFALTSMLLLLLVVVVADVSRRGCKKMSWTKSVEENNTHAINVS